MTHNFNPLKTIINSIESSKIDIDHTIWYVMYCYAFSDMHDTNVEIHHILPRKLFPEYKNLNLHHYNSAKLGIKEHIIAHYILAKAIKVQSTLAAFNMMKRALKKIDDIIELSILYEEYRQSFSDMFRTINKGRKHNQATRKKLSDITRGTVPVFSPENRDHIFRISTSDPRYLSGELVHNATGRYHSDQTKQLMSENGIKNMVRIFEILNPDNTRYISNNEQIPIGYLKGDENQIRIARNRFTEASHWHNPITGEDFRLKPSDEIPLNAIKGRSPNVRNPFEGSMFRKNFKTNTIFNADTVLFDIYCGSPTAKNAFIFENKICFNLDTILKHFPTKINKSIATRLIYQDAQTIIYHNKASKEVREYLRKFNYYTDIPFKIMPISEVIDTITIENWLQ